MLSQQHRPSFLPNAPEAPATSYLASQRRSSLEQDSRPSSPSPEMHLPRTRLYDCRSPESSKRSTRRFSKPFFLSADLSISESFTFPVDSRRPSLDNESRPRPPSPAPSLRALRAYECPSPEHSKRASRRFSKPLFLSPEKSSIISYPAGSPITPTPRSKSPLHSRRKTDSGDLHTDAQKIVLDYEKRIALLESQNARMSVELDTTKDCLIDEREERAVERYSAALVSGVPHSSTIDGDVGEQFDSTDEHRMHIGLMDTLQKIRAQNTLLTRSLREYKVKSANLSNALETERNERNGVEEEIQRLSQLNFTLLEHNKLLVGRDSSLQEDISTLITKSQADDWMRGILEAELRQARQTTSTPQEQDLTAVHPDAVVAPVAEIKALELTLEHQGPLRAQLISTQDELHITRLRLVESEKQCDALTKKISSLQDNLTLCLDSSSEALEVERDLRAEVADRLYALEEENIILLGKLNASQLPRAEKLMKEAESQTEERNDIPNFSPSSQSTSHPAELKFQRRERLLDRHFRISAYKRLSRPQNKYLLPADATPMLTSQARNSPLAVSRSSSFDIPETPESATSTLVTSPPALLYRPLSSNPLTPTTTSFRFRNPRFSPAAAMPPVSIVPSLDSQPSHSFPSPVSIQSTKKPSLLLATTLSRKLSSSTFTFKSDSTIHVDFSSVNDDLNNKSDSADARLARTTSGSRSLRHRRRNSKRASKVLAGIVLTYPELERGSEESLANWTLV